MALTVTAVPSTFAMNEDTCDSTNSVVVGGISFCSVDSESTSMASLPH